MKKLFLLLISLLAVGVLSSACGIPQEDHDAVVADRDAAQMQLANLQPALNQLVVAVDTVRGFIPSEAGPSCAVNSQWYRGEMIVWRVRVFDPETGNQLPANPSDLIPTIPDADAIAALTEGLTVTVHLSDGQSFPMHFGGHGGDSAGESADYFWTFGWEIPADYPTGSVEDWVTVDWSAESKTGRSQPFQVSSSMLTIIE